jgi:FKBP-type peptidyl-prolyl cis-trans isomerase 2
MGLPSYRKVILLPFRRKATATELNLHPAIHDGETHPAAEESQWQCKTIHMEAKKGDVVRVHYTGRLVDGTQFDSSAGREPLEFTVGAGQMIRGFDAGVVGMRVGDRKTLNIAPEDAYGPRDEEAVIEFPAENVPDDMALEPGMQLTLRNQYGQPVPVVIIEVREEVILMDANHMLAGQELVFDVELVEIVGGKPLIITP